MQIIKGFHSNLYFGNIHTFLQSSKPGEVILRPCAFLGILVLSSSYDLISVISTSVYFSWLEVLKLHKSTVLPTRYSSSFSAKLYYACNCLGQEFARTRSDSMSGSQVFRILSIFHVFITL